MRRHVDLCLGGDRILSIPVARDGLVLSVEVDAGLAVEGVCTATSDRLLVTGEGEHGQGDGDGPVKAIVSSDAQ